jgi:DNA-binding CsgD family transcriptional regulator
LIEFTTICKHHAYDGITHSRFAQRSYCVRPLPEKEERAGSHFALLSIKLVTKVFPSELASLFPIPASKVGSMETSNWVLPKPDLSRRQIEILRCLTDGQSNKMIAKNLKIAEATVKVHVKRLYAKSQIDGNIIPSFGTSVRGCRYTGICEHVPWFEHGPQPERGHCPEPDAARHS